MLNEIKYVGFYDIQSYKNENRNYVLSAVNKMNYIIESIIKSGKKIFVLSPSWSINKSGRYSSRSIEVKKKFYLTLNESFEQQIELLE